jgi:hypothetical protein
MREYLRISVCAALVIVLLCAQSVSPPTGGGGSGTVTSVAGNNGLTGTVTTTGNIGLASTANNTALCNNSGGAAPPASANCTTTGTGNAVMAVSPALTGSPTAPTQTTSDSSTKIATDAFVQANVAAGAGAICPNGTVNQIFTTTGSSACQASTATADQSGNIVAPGTLASTGNTSVGNNLSVVGTATFNTGCSGAGCISSLAFFDSSATHTMNMNAPTSGFNGTWQLPNQAGTFAIAASSPLVLNASTGALTVPTTATPQFANLGIAQAADTSPITFGATIAGSPAAGDFGPSSTSAGLTSLMQSYDGGNLHTYLAQLASANVAQTAQSASIGTTAIITPAATVDVLVIYNLYAHATGTGNVTLSVSANDGVGTVTQTTQAVLLSALTNTPQAGTWLFHVASSQALNYATTYTSTGNYNLYVKVVPLP